MGPIVSPLLVFFKERERESETEKFIKISVFQFEDNLIIFRSSRVNIGFQQCVWGG